MNENEKANQNLQVKEPEKKVTSVTVNNFLKKATIVGKKVVANLQETAIVTSDKIKEDNKLRRYRKYHPITVEEYHSAKFNIPNVIKITDDAETRNIDVCKNSIGRLVTEKGVEIFYINDEFIKTCGLHFVPAPVCDAIYHVDNFDRTRFIRIDEIFAKALEEKLAELEHIAFCLGAIRCSVEIIEENRETKDRKTNAQSNISVPIKKKISVGENVSMHNHGNSMMSSSGKITASFSGNPTPNMPRLKWFEHNDNMRNLIEMRLSEGSSIKSKTLILKGTSSTSMTQKTAAAIDAEIMKIGGSASRNVEQQAQIERNSTLIFEVVFEE